ncbi:MAG TPA: hypothetical protein VGR31_07360 [Planctomycetota bacterium]|jgi:photosystem II stability/assembly factor-like uncharacterized protein|nr:hypothetical protein [Planctomycetota bacterium]
MRPISFALLLVLAATARAQHQVPHEFPYPSPWVELGPAPIGGSYAGRISAIVCSPTNANRFFVGGADSGVWRTTDGGVTWDPRTDQMPTTAIGALALDPNAENTIYAGTGEANYANHSRYGLGLFKSTDGGDSWVQLAESTFGGRCFSRIVVDPANSQIVYASIGHAGGFPELAAAKGHPGATGAVGCFKSIDGGVTWSHLAGGLPNVEGTDIALDPSNSAVLYAAIGRIFGSAQNGVWKSIDAGATWVKLAGGLPASSVIGRVTIGVAPSQPARLYALIASPSTSDGSGASTQGAYRSDDSGAHWTSLPVGSIQATYGWYLSVVSVSPTSANTVFFGGLTLSRSTDSGGTFSNVTPLHVDLHAAAWDASGRLLIGDDGGVTRSTNLGGSWSTLNNGLGTVQFYAGLSSHPTNPLIFFGGAQDNGTNRRNTASKAWGQVLGGDGGWTQVDPVNPNRVFGEYQGSGNLFRSTDGGNNFSSAANGINSGDRNCFLPPYLIDATTPTRMFYATQRIYRSLDGGSNWSALSGDLTNGAGAIRALALAPSNSNVLYAATNDGKILVSTNGGSVFQTVLTGIPGWPRTTRELFVDPTDASKAYLAVAAFGTAQIRRTIDGGQNWTNLDQTLPDVPVNVVAVQPGATDHIFAGTDDGLWFSPDAGATWSRYGTGLPRAVVVDILLEPARHRMVVATQGRGAWETRL